MEKKPEKKLLSVTFMHTWVKTADILCLYSEVRGFRTQGLKTGQERHGNHRLQEVACGR